MKDRMTKMNAYARDMAALNGTTVTQGHADYCEANGHAVHRVDGEVQPMCPRCGTFTGPAANFPTPAAKPGRCLQRVAKVGKTPTQCVKGHAHEDDHEDRFGQTFANHAIVPGAEPLSPTAQALADAGHARDEAAREYREAKTPAQRAAAEQKYEDAEALRQKANEAHHAAREAAGDFGPRTGREAREALKRLDAPKGTHPLAKRLADDHGLKF